MADPGRKPKGHFDNEEIDKFLDCLRNGSGIALAIEELKTSHRRYKLTEREVKGFRKKVRLAMACSRQSLVKMRFKAAQEGSERAQEFLINRDDRARQFARDMKHKRAELAAKNPVSKEDLNTESPKRIIIPDTDDRHTP